jgi:hypothetical protein
MFTGFERFESPFVVEAVWERDVDNIDGRVVD